MEKLKELLLKKEEELKKLKKINEEIKNIDNEISRLIERKEK